MQICLKYYECWSNFKYDMYFSETILIKLGTVTESAPKKLNKASDHAKTNLRLNKIPYFSSSGFPKFSTIFDKNYRIS